MKSFVLGLALVFGLAGAVNAADCESCNAKVAIRSYVTTSPVIVRQRIVTSPLFVVSPLVTVDSVDQVIAAPVVVKQRVVAPRVVRQRTVIR